MFKSNSFQLKHKILTSKRVLHLILLSLVLLVYAEGFGAITITGTKGFCSFPSSNQVYTIKFTGQTQTHHWVEVTNGTIESEDMIERCEDEPVRPNISVITSTKITLWGGNCTSFELEIEVDWNSFPGTKIRAWSDNSTDVTQNIFLYNDGSAYMSGPGPQVCQSFTSGTYVAMSVVGHASSVGYSWSATSTGGSLYIASPSSVQTYISGFTSGNFYTINCQLTCNGINKRNLSKIVETALSCKLKNSELGIVTLEVREVEGEKGSGSDWKEASQSRPEIEQKYGAGSALYPNPVNSGVPLNISMPLQEVVDEVLIFDMRGVQRMKITAIDKDGTFSIRDLESGTYVVKIRSGESIFTNKITVAN